MPKYAIALRMPDSYHRIRPHMCNYNSALPTCVVHRVIYTRTGMELGSTTILGLFIRGYKSQQPLGV